MLADLDLLLTAVFVTADDLLPAGGRNAMRRVTDAEVVTLAVPRTANSWRRPPAPAAPGFQASRPAGVGSRGGERGGERTFRRPRAPKITADAFLSAIRTQTRTRRKPGRASNGMSAQAAKAPNPPSDPQRPSAESTL
jgi:hypothetical protein